MALRILLLAHAFNRLAQRLFVELRAAGHEVALELDIADAVTEEAVALFDPQLLIAPYLKRRIPEAVWSRRMCWVVHPGIPGDRGPAALDRAILRGEAEWGVSVIQAQAEFDAGPVWASAAFTMRAATKSSLYRREVCDAALAAVRSALARWQPGMTQPPADAVPSGRHRGRAWPSLTRAERRIDWRRATTAEALRAVYAADGAPGLIDELDGVACRWFDAHDARPALARAPAGAAGEFVARRGPALLRRTADGGLWLGHARREPTPLAPEPLKRPAVEVFASLAHALPELPAALDRAQCLRLRDALRHARSRPTRVLVLAGGPERAQRITQRRLPLGVAQALELGIVDACLAPGAAAFERAARALAAARAAGNGWAARVAAKAASRAADEAARPLAAYRKEELARMHRAFYGFDPSYHVARDHFVRRRAHAWTPCHLAPHRAAR